MGKQNDHLTVRRHDRWGCDINGSLSVDDIHGEQVVFSRAVTESGGGVPVRIVDCSRGGLGLHCSVYLPRGTRVIVEFTETETPGEDKNTLHLRVQRGSMIDRTPSYYIGTSVIDQADSVQPLAKLIAMAEQSDGAAGEAA